jgi:hypothetical protein
MDITGIPDGRYAFRTVLDPDDQIIEADISNNTSTTFVEISGRMIRRLDGP